VSIAEMYKNIFATDAIERCFLEIELRSISLAQLDWQTGIPRFAGIRSDKDARDITRDGAA
jgi:hypothetical protein